MPLPQIPAEAKAEGFRCSSHFVGRLQFIKGGFSYRLKKEFGDAGEVWQRGFSEIRIKDREGYQQHRDYTAQNPVSAGLVDSLKDFHFPSSLAGAKAQGLKPGQELLLDG